MQVPARLLALAFAASLLHSNMAVPLLAAQSSTWPVDPSDPVRPCYFGRNFTNVNTDVCGGAMWDVAKVLNSPDARYFVVIDAFALPGERVGAESRRAASVQRFLVRELGVSPSLILLRLARVQIGTAEPQFGVVTFTLVPRGARTPPMMRPLAVSVSASASN